jgi:hypothetical protein
MQALEKEFYSPEGKQLARQAYGAWLIGPEGREMVNNAFNATSPGMYPIWTALTLEKQQVMLKTIIEGRPAYSHVRLERAIQWKDSTGRMQQAQQNCSMHTCWPTSFVALEMCRLFNGINASISPSLSYADGRGSMIWASYLETIIRTQWENGGQPPFSRFMWVGGCCTAACRCTGNLAKPSHSLAPRPHAKSGAILLAVGPCW